MAGDTFVRVGARVTLLDRCTTNNTCSEHHHSRREQRVRRRRRQRLWRQPTRWRKRRRGRRGRPLSGRVREPRPSREGYVAWLTLCCVHAHSYDCQQAVARAAANRLSPAARPGPAPGVVPSHGRSPRLFAWCGSTLVPPPPGRCPRRALLPPPPSSRRRPQVWPPRRAPLFSSARLRRPHPLPLTPGSLSSLCLVWGPCPC